MLGHWQGELRVFLGEWMVSGLLALLGGPLLFVCPRQAGFEQRCLHTPSLVCPVGEGLALEALFPQPGGALSSEALQDQMLSRALKSCLARRKLQGLHSQLRLFVSPEMPSEVL